MPGIDHLLDEVDKSRQELIELAQDLVKIPTVNTGTMPTGNETDACVLIMKKLGKEKIASEIIESAPTRGSVIARLPSRTHASTAKLLFLSHLDVVPVGDEKQWTHPPFGGSIQQGRIYGRGAWDCKGLAAAQIMAMIIIFRSGMQLKRSLVLASTADEETASGGKYGIGYLVAHHRDMIEAEYVINEGGGKAIDTPRGPYFCVSIGEKGRSEVIIDFHGNSCHASQPWAGRNPLADMARAILRIEDYKPKIALDDTLWKKLEQVFNLPGHTDEAHVDDILETNFKTSPLYSDLKAFTRMTIVPTMTAAGYKSNVIPEMASLVCDVRTLSHQSGDYVKAEIESILGDLVRREVRIISSVSASRSLVDPHFMKAISDSLSRISPGKSRILETLSTGYTDSSVMRGIGAIAYGFEPYHPDSDPHLINYHGLDESIAVDDLVFRTRAYVSICHDMLVQ